MPTPAAVTPSTLRRRKDPPRRAHRQSSRRKPPQRDKSAMWLRIHSAKGHTVGTRPLISLSTPRYCIGNSGPRGKNRGIGWLPLPREAQAAEQTRRKIR